LKGNGWTVGSYLGWKLTSSIRFDAAVAYSGIGYDGTAGTAQGNFDGRRWLISSGLTGYYEGYGFDIEPSAKVYALWEHENAYTDSLGTDQADRNFSTGRASGGLKLSYPIASTATIISPKTMRSRSWRRALCRWPRRHCSMAGRRVSPEALPPDSPAAPQLRSAANSAVSAAMSGSGPSAPAPMFRFSALGITVRKVPAPRHGAGAAADGRAWREGAGRG
jgi:hypothetical protein